MNVLFKNTLYNLTNSESSKIKLYYYCDIYDYKINFENIIQCITSY